MISRIQLCDRDTEVIRSLLYDNRIDEEDTTDYSQVFIEKPWGFEYSIYKNEHVDLWLLSLAAGHKTSFHCHPGKKTSLVVLAGEVLVTTLSGEHTITVGRGLQLDKGVFHSTQTISPNGALILESETPVNKKNLVRFDDVYGRRGKRYESGKCIKVRDPNAYQSFYGSADKSCEKRFGHCLLRLTRDVPSLTICDGASANGIGIILKGDLTMGDTSLSHGDAFSLAHLALCSPRHPFRNDFLFITHAPL